MKTRTGNSSSCPHVWINVGAFPERPSIDLRDGKPLALQGGGQALDVLAVVRLDGDFELHLLEAVGHARLIVDELDDVRMFSRNDLRHLEELAGLVGQLHGEAEDAAARDERFADESRDGRDVDVAAREDGHDLLALEGQPCERREREDARAFGDELVLLDEEEERSETVMMSSRYLRQKAKVSSPGVFTAQPSATVSTPGSVVT